MKEDYVSFEIAKLLKEKGFDEICNYIWGVPNIDEGYVLEKLIIHNGQTKNSELIDDAYAAPTLQMAVQWLREKHNIHITIDCDICDSFDFYSIIRIKSEESWKTYVEYEDEGSNTYEEALERAIKYCLTNLI